MTPYTWRRSSRCASGDSCVYVAPGGRGRVLVAESGEPGPRVVRVTSDAWAAFLGAVTARRP